jgi:O-antigen/teichoic acid export membrane protein
VPSSTTSEPVAVRSLSATESPSRAGIKGGGPASSVSVLRSGSVYTIAQTAPRIVSFLLLPVFTHVLSPSEYGQLSVALSASAVASIAFALGLDVIIFRNLFQLAGDPNARQRFIGSTWTFLLFGPLAMAAVLAVGFAPLLSTSHVLSASRLALSLLGSAFFVSATTVPLAFLRAEERTRDYLIVTGICTLGSTLLTVVFVVFVKGGVTGWLLALLTANALTLLVAARLIPYKRPRPFDRPMVKHALKLSLPVLPHFVAMWSLQLVDRLLVAGLLSTASTGLYSLGSNLALPMLSMVIGFGQGFMPAYAKAGVDGDRDSSLSRVMAMQVGVVAVLSVTCALLGPSAVRLLTAHRYASAAPLVPWIVLGYAFLGLYSLPMNGITLTHGRTKGVAIVSGLGAVTNIGLIVSLAPNYGLESVAIASAAGYAVLLIGIVAFAKIRDAVLTYPVKRIALILGVAILGYAVGALGVGYSDVVDLGLRSCCVLATSVLVVAVFLYPQVPSAHNLRRVLRRPGLANTE